METGRLFTGLALLSEETPGVFDDLLRIASGSWGPSYL